MTFCLKGCVLLLALLSFSTLANDNQFIIGVGDEIAVDVYNEPDLNVRVKVGSSGRIRVPLVGDVMVRGKTAQQVSEEIEAALFDGYLVNPIVSVFIETVRPFYIRGAVKNPGAYTLNIGMTVEQAIAVGGGLTARADSAKWYIIREGQSERSRANSETVVMPGDIIEVEESFF